MSDEGCYIEFVEQGAYVKVSAIDAKTGIEASIVGDPNATRQRLTDLAIRKLRYVMAKQNPQ